MPRTYLCAIDDSFAVLLGHVGTDLHHQPLVPAILQAQVVTPLPAGRRGFFSFSSLLPFCEVLFLDRVLSGPAWVFPVGVEVRPAIRLLPLISPLHRLAGDGPGIRFDVRLRKILCVAMTMLSLMVMTCLARRVHLRKRLRIRGQPETSHKHHQNRHACHGERSEKPGPLAACGSGDHDMG